MTNVKRKIDLVHNSEFPHDDRLVSDNSGDASEEDNDLLDTPSSMSSMTQFGNGVNNVIPSSKRSKKDNTSISEDISAVSSPEPLKAPLSEEPLEAPLSEEPLDAPLSGEQKIKLLSKKYEIKINTPPTDRPARVYADGIYDLFHFGHAKALKQAKTVLPNVWLLVGVCDDTITHRKKGLTVLNEAERAESVRHCKWADEVIEHVPWEITQEFLDKHNIDYVAHDVIPYSSGDSDDVYSFVKKQGRFLPIERTEGISTSDLITRIVKDYDLYIRRNLERGVSPRDLGLSFLKEKEMSVKKNFSNIRSSIHENWRDTKVDLSDDLSGFKNELALMWETRSQEYIRGFASLFGAEGVMNKFFRRGSRTNSDDSQSSESASPDNRSRSTSPVRNLIDYLKGDKGQSNQA